MGKKKMSLWQKARLMWTIIKTLMEVRKMRKGVKTSEFWLTLITIVGTLIPVLQGAVSPTTWTIMSAILVGLYTIARAIVKLTASKTDDEIVDKIGQEIISRLDFEEDKEPNRK